MLAREARPSPRGDRSCGRVLFIGTDGLRRADTRRRVDLREPIGAGSAMLFRVMSR